MFKQSSVLTHHERFGPPHAVLNLSKLGLRYFRIGIRASSRSQTRLIETLSTHPNVGWIFRAKGYFNLAIGLWVKDNTEMNDVSQQIRHLLDPHRDQIVFQSELTSLTGFGNRPIHPTSAPMTIVDATLHRIELSPLEVDYVKLVALDNSLDDKELCQLLSIEEDALRRARTRLQETGVIVGSQERIQYAGVYMKVFIDSLSRRTEDAERALLTKLWTDPACIYAERANAKYDLEFELILPNKHALRSYLKDFSEYQIAELTENVYTNLYPVSKVANLKEIQEALLSQNGPIIDFRNSKLWYLNYRGAEAYLNIYTGNQRYFESMEKVELDLFDEVGSWLKKHHVGETFSVVDIGSGDGLKGRVFIERVGEASVKAYYPVDIQPIELAAAMNAHAEGTYAKHPTLLTIEKLSTRFPTKGTPNERQIFIFFGGTYGNFQTKDIHPSLQPLVKDTSTLLITMPIRHEKKTDAEIVQSYASAEIEHVAFGPLSQVGFKREDFVPNQDYPNLIVHIHLNEDRRLVTSLVLAREITVFKKTFDAGTRFLVTTSWKPTLEEFKATLEKDFRVKEIVHNKDMAIAIIEP